MGFHSRGKAHSLGAWGGAPAAMPLWKLSKRQLIEAALHLASLQADADGVEAAVARVQQEVRILRMNKLV